MTAGENAEPVAVADLDADHAHQQAMEYGITQDLTTEGLINDPSVEIVLNLTPPAAHDDVVQSAILAGKSVFTEKPLAATPMQGDELVRLAAEYCWVARRTRSSARDCRPAGG